MYTKSVFPETKGPMDGVHSFARMVGEVNTNHDPACLILRGRLKTLYNPTLGPRS